MKRKIVTILMFLIGSMGAFTQNMTFEEKNGVYVAEWFIQSVNETHSSSKTKDFLENYKYPCFFVVNTDMYKDKIYNDILTGEGCSQSLTDFSFAKYNDSIYATDVYNNYYFKITSLENLYKSRNNFQDSVLFYTYLYKKYLENFINDASIEKTINIDSLSKLNVFRTYEEDLYIFDNSYCTDFVIDKKCYQITDDEIIIFQGQRDYTTRQERYIFDSELKRENYFYDKFNRNLNIILRSEDIVVAEELTKLSKEELRILRNAVYAKYGRAFKSEDLKNWFAKKSWYTINPEFTEKKFTIFDKRNIEIIQAVENLKK